MKKGNKLICKKRCFSSGIELFVGQTYEIDNIQNEHVYIKLGKDKAHVDIDNLYYYFYTEKELRKLKLDKLNEIEK